MMRNLPIFVLVYFLLTFTQVNAQLLAFPTAEGAGKFVTGGRGTLSIAPVIFEVTRIDDPLPISTPTVGTFRWACTNNSPSAPHRIIVFRVSGTIRLNGALSLNRANTTIAGQTAPGDGICIADYPVTIGANNIIVRYIRFRLGDKNEAATSGNGDAFGSSNDRSNIVIDHCSMSWSNDEILSLYHGTNNTIQWNFMTEPLDRSYHDEGSGVQNHAYGGILGGRQLSVHHNLYAHFRGRGPRFDGHRAGVAANFEDTIDYRNNVIYNWADYNVNGGEGGNYNVVNNYYKYGPSTPNSSTSGVNRRNMLINPYEQNSVPVFAYGKYFLTGNYCDNSTAVTARNWLGAAFSGGNLNDSTASKVIVPFNHTPILTQQPIDAYNDVLANAGCTLPRRDTLDQRIVNDVKNRTGRLIDCQGGYPSQSPFTISQNAWPTLTNGTAQIDTDKDGMPDTWELARGLNPNLATDRNGYISTSGYNNIENYINGDTIVAVGVTNTCVQTRNITSLNSGQWIHARDTTYSGYLNNTYTASVDSNHIVASIFDNGNFGEFSISYYTSSINRTDVNGEHYARRNITINPINPSLITQPVTVRFYISKTEFDALKAADPRILTINDLVVVKSNDNACINTLPTLYSLIAQSNNAVFGTYQNGYYVEFQTTSFSTFFLQYKFVITPVKLIYFSAVKQNQKDAFIQWQTSQEVNHKKFVLQRKAGTNNWLDIAIFNGDGDSYTTKNYQFYDVDYKKGVYYYRLLDLSNDNKETYSIIKSLTFNKNETFSVFPNPAIHQINIVINQLEPYDLFIYNVAGKVISREKIAVKVYQKNISNLPSGTYYIKAVSRKEASIIKIEKIN